jgi:hypothetical protein
MAYNTLDYRYLILSIVRYSKEDNDWETGSVSIGPTRERPTLSPDDRKRSSSPNAMFFRMPDDGRSPKTQ